MEKLENLNFSGKQITGMLFSSTKIDLAALIALESWTWSENLSEENNKLCCKLVERLYLGLIEIQSLNNIVLAYVNRVFESLKKKINVFKELIISGVSGFYFWVIEPIRKDRNRGIFRKLHLSRKQTAGILFSWVKTDDLDKNFSKSLIKTDIYLGGNHEGQVD